MEKNSPVKFADIDIFGKNNAILEKNSPIKLPDRTIFGKNRARRRPASSKKVPMSLQKLPTSPQKKPKRLQKSLLSTKKKLYSPIRSPASTSFPAKCIQIILIDTNLSTLCCTCFITLLFVCKSSLQLSITR